MKAIWKAASFPLALLALNVYFTKELFTIEYTQYMGSIEAAFISISRYMLDNWRDLSWFPLWYGGIPFQNTYPPLLHAIVAVTAGIFRISPALAHHVITACMYCAGPVSLYFLAVRLSGSRWYGFWAGWLYSIFTPTYYLMKFVRSGMGNQMGLRRLQTLACFGEGPHLTSLALLPLALLSLDVALARRRPVWYFLAAVSMAMIVLSNWLGAVALALAVFAYVLARSKGSDAWNIWGTTAGLAVWAYALACSWIPPSTIRDIRYNAQYVGPYEHVYATLPLYATGLILALLAVKYGLHRFQISKPFQFFVLFAILLSAIPLASDWARITIVPQPERYHLEADLAICLLAAFLLKALADKFSARYRIVAAALLLLLTFYPAKLDRRYARRMLKPIDIHRTIEYKNAQWFREHLDGQRVFAAGTISFWLNAFGDTPQFAGGFDQGRVNRVITRVQYQIQSGDGAGERAGEIAKLWLRAYGVHAITVGGPASMEAYKPFLHPDVVAAALPEAWREGDDGIYLVPQRTVSIAHVVARQAVVRDAPVNGLDIRQAQVYVEALEDPKYPAAQFRWTSHHSAEIEAPLGADDLLSVRMTYHPGWHAAVNGASRKVFGDGLGQLVVEPKCEGPCVVQLVYDGGVEMLTARTVSWSALAGGLIWIAATWRKQVAGGAYGRA
jgi:hypothetical protein